MERSFPTLESCWAEGFDALVNPVSRSRDGVLFGEERPASRFCSFGGVGGATVPSFCSATMRCLYDAGSSGSSDMSTRERLICSGTAPNADGPNGEAGMFRKSSFSIRVVPISPDVAFEAELVFELGIAAGG